MLLILCIAVLAVADTTFSDAVGDNDQDSNGQSCGRHQTFNECGTACPLTCENYDNPPLICNKECVSGCQCDDGYVKAPDGNCVTPENCPPCGNNQHYESCACPLTCDNYKNPPDDCPDCEAGCVCNDGFVQVPRTGECVRRKQCFDNPPVCPRHSQYNPCGTACPKTCDTLNSPPGGCAAVCNPSCQCDDGYVKDENRQCVKEEDCPIDDTSLVGACGRHQTFNDCGTACPLTCKNYKNPPPVCNKRCVSGCECDKGYVKAPDGNCVSPQNCPPCGKNQHYESCACPLTCDNYKNPPDDCPDCEAGCVCNDGFVQVPRTGECVRREQCFDNPPVCPRNSRYDECGTACPKTCDNYNDPPGVCPTVCNPSCQCNKGYVKNKQRQCVKPNKCPAKTSAPNNCPANEEPSNCVIPCNNCKRRGDCSYICRKGCDCKKGYYRNAYRRCIPARLCPAPNN